MYIIATTLMLATGSVIVTVDIPAGTKINPSAPIKVETKKSDLVEVLSHKRVDNQWTFSVRSRKSEKSRLEGVIDFFVCGESSCRQIKHRFSEGIGVE